LAVLVVVSAVGVSLGGNVELGCNGSPVRTMLGFDSRRDMGPFVPDQSVCVMRGGPGSVEGQPYAIGVCLSAVGPAVYGVHHGDVRAVGKAGVALGLELSRDLVGQAFRVRAYRGCPDRPACRRLAIGYSNWCREGSG